MEKLDGKDSFRKTAKKTAKKEMEIYGWNDKLPRSELNQIPHKEKYFSPKKQIKSFNRPTILLAMPCFFFCHVERSETSHLVNFLLFS